MIDRIPSSRIAASGAADARATRISVLAAPMHERSAAAASPSLANEPRRMVAEGPPIDAGRVERLRASLAEGSFVIDPERIAAAMMAAEQAQ